MPDSGITDGSVYTSSFHDTYVRQQVVTQCTAATRPTGVEGRLIYETDTDRMFVYTGSAWFLQSYHSTTGRPGVILSDATQSIANTTATDITWGTETSDVDGWTSGGSATLTVPSGWDGRILVSYRGAWASPPGTQSGIGIFLNGTGVASYETSVGSLFSRPTVCVTLLVAATNTIKVQAYQNSGGAVNLDSVLDIFYLGR